MQELFAALTRAVEGTPAVALGAAFVWGILSILLSPCHLASIPLIVGFIADRDETTTRRAFRLSVVFSVGVLVSIALIGIITAALGRLVGDLGSIGNIAVSIVFFIFGLYLMDILPLDWSGLPATTERRGPVAALGLGFVFGIGLGPCTFAFLAPLLLVVFDRAQTDVAGAAALLLAFALGHCGVIVAAGTAFSRVQGFLSWGERSGVARWVRRGCGALVVLAGVYLLLR
jgi:cytochrome c-type biogenesis protein